MNAEQSQRSFSWRLGLLFALYGLLLFAVPFLADLTFPRNGFLEYYLLSSQIAVLSFALCTRTKTNAWHHILAIGCLTLLSLGIAIPVSYDDIPYSLRGGELHNRYFFFSFLWMWFVFLVMSAFVYLVMRVLLASLVNGLLYLSGRLRFSIGNMLLTTIMVVICLTLSMQSRSIESEYAYQAFVIAALSILAAPTTWALLAVDLFLQMRKVSSRSILGARLAYWVTIAIVSLIWFSHLCAMYGMDLPSKLHSILLDGRFDSRDLDAFGLFWCTTVVNTLFASFVGIRPGTRVIESDSRPL